MHFMIPILVQRQGSSKSQVFTASPLINSRIVASNRFENQCLSQLAKELRGYFRELVDEQHYTTLLAYTWNPELSLHTLKVVPELKKQSTKLHLPIVQFQRDGRSFGFCPLIANWWFDVRRGETLRNRVQDVLQQSLREDGSVDVLPEWLEYFQPPRTYALSTIDLSVSLKSEPKRNDQQGLADLLGGKQILSGQHELDTVGTRLEELYPDGLHRAYLRDQLVDQLTRWRAAGAARPLLLLGEPSVGKTAVVHEWVRRRLGGVHVTYGSKDGTYLVSPQRLVAGMMYVGQWEDRWHAMLKACRKKSHVLYLDDMLGMYVAGQSAASSLSAAHVLKAYVQRGEVPLIVEMTPEQLRVFRERDRGFADLFDTVRVDPPDDQTLVRMLHRLIRDLERTHTCQIDHGVLKSAIELSRQFAVRGVFPGTAAGVLRHLASEGSRSHGSDVTEQDAIRLFARRTGLSVSMIDGEQCLERSQVTNTLQSQLIGQPEAIEAMADVIGLAKSQLSDRQRPLSTLLFVGPTGVGKTEAAKALANYLFGSSERLVRFDLNEFGAPGSARRLIGSFDQPDGLLTTAIRQYPYCVLLLDEIEKAHPEVFDVLLSVLGEGRLSDARGRTADFSRAIIIMTSNLGAGDAVSAIGFGDDDATVKQRFMRAVRAHWRPEFFNRIDRVVAFRKLDRENLREIARLAMQRILQRDGFGRRSILITGADPFLDRIVEQSCRDVLGARAIHRGIERSLLTSLAKKMSVMDPSDIAVLQPRNDTEQLRWEVIQSTVTVPALGKRTPAAEISPDWLTAADEYLKEAIRFCKGVLPSEAEDTRLVQGADRFSALQCLEELRQIGAQVIRALDRTERNERREPRPPLPSYPTDNFRPGYRDPRTSWERRVHKDRHAIQDIAEYLTEEPEPDHPWIRRYPQEAAELWMDSLAKVPLLLPHAGWHHEKVLVLVRPIDANQTACARRLLDWIKGIFVGRTDWQFDEDPDYPSAANPDSPPRYGMCPLNVELLRASHGGVVRGRNASCWLEGLDGTYVCRIDDLLSAAQLVTIRLSDDDDVAQVTADVQQRHAAFANASWSDPRDPFHLRPFWPLVGPCSPLNYPIETWIAKRRDLPFDSYGSSHQEIPRG